MQNGRRRPLDFEQWDEHSCSRAVGYQVSYMLGHAVPAAPLEFERVVLGVGGDPQWTFDMAFDVYLNRLGVEQIVMRRYGPESLEGVDGFERFQALMREDCGDVGAAYWTQARFEQLVQMARACAAAMDTRLLEHVEAVPSDDAVRRLLADGYLVVVECRPRVSRSGETISHVMLVYGVRNGCFQIYDPAPRWGSTLFEVERLTEPEVVVALEAYRVQR